jgi:transcriptional regulator with XRE-family HTH domain
MSLEDRRRIRMLLGKARQALGVTQAELAVVVQSSKRTVSRWEGGRSTPAEFHMTRLAEAVHPTDPSLAAELAALANETLLSLGLERPPPAPAPAPAPEPPARSLPSDRDLVDSIVCAAAEAVATTPQAIRPALIAAFDRADSVGLAIAEVRRALRSQPAPKSPAVETIPPP